MQERAYVKEFEKLGFGMFVHFGLYSMVEKGEWYWKSRANEQEQKAYWELPKKFKVNQNWATELVKNAKRAGCRYITLTTRHHDGFSLYDTCGLNDFDAPHSACGRDLIREFVDACRAGGIVPFFYHTHLDWHHPDYLTDFPKYLAYLRKSVEILCKNYGKIGGLWFDGMWDKAHLGDDWEEDAPYKTIRRYQPDAMIINNTGLHRRGALGHIEIDSVTFERGKPCEVDNSDRPRAGEMCEVLNDHWGYAAEDCCYKSLPTLLKSLMDCRHCGCNFLLNVGPMGNGRIKEIDRGILAEIGKWIKSTGDMVYRVKPCEVEAEGAYVLSDGTHYYAVIEDVPMKADTNVAIGAPCGVVKILDDRTLQNAIWLDSGEAADVDGNTVAIKPFPYGTSRYIRVLRFEL